MQVMPFWARLIGDGDPARLFHMQANLRFGCVILRHYLDIEGGDTVTLDPNQGFSVAKGVVHRTRAPEGRTVILMVERAGVVPTGD